MAIMDLPKPGRGKPERKARNGWADLYDWRSVSRGAGASSVVQQAYLQVRAAILSGGLRAGTKLPSSRDLAERMGVARASVVAAFEQLVAEGYLSARVGSGTFVSDDCPLFVEAGRFEVSRSPAPLVNSPQRGRAIKPVRQPTVSLATGPAYSDDRPFNTGRTLVDARTIEDWRRLTHRTVRTLRPNDLGYSDPLGLPDLRSAVCEYLRAARAVRCDPEQVVICSGTQHAIDLTARVLLSSADEVWVEDPGYPLTRDALTVAGIVTRPIPVDALGIDVAAGMRIAPRARAAFVTPSHQFPTGVVLSMARRLELIAWARNSGSWIIEDDYVSEFRYSGRPLASLQGLDDGERVIYVGTLNKALFPGLRLGYAVVPSSLLPSFARVRELMDRQPSSLSQAIAAPFLSEGYLAAHIRRMRLQYRAQRDALAAQLLQAVGDRLAIDIPDQGMHLVAHLHDSAPSYDVAIEQAALRAGIVVRALSRLYVSAAPRPALMLGFSGFPQQLIRPAAIRLAKVINAAYSPCRSS